MGSSFAVTVTVTVAASAIPASGVATGFDLLALRPPQSSTTPSNASSICVASILLAPPSSPPFLHASIGREA